MRYKSWALSCVALMALGAIAAQPAAAGGAGASGVVGKVNATLPPPTTHPDPSGTIAAGARTGTAASGAVKDKAQKSTSSAGAQSQAEVGAGASSTLSAGTPVNKIENSTALLAGAEVKSKDGITIGTVQNVQIGSDGKASNVTVAVKGDVAEGTPPTSRATKVKTVTLAAKDLAYDGSKRIVTSSLTQSEIDNLVTAQATMGSKPADNKSKQSPDTKSE